jgi:hypothetical protein
MMHVWKSLHRRKHVFMMGFMPNFMMFYECQNMSKPVFRSGNQVTSQVTLLAVRVRSPSPGIAQEETHGDALSFSQRSIGFVAPDSQLSTFCPGEFSFQVYVTSS